MKILLICLFTGLKLTLTSDYFEIPPELLPFAQVSLFGVEPVRQELLKASFCLLFIS